MEIPLTAEEVKIIVNASSRLNRLKLTLRQGAIAATTNSNQTAKQAMTQIVAAQHRFPALEDAVKAMGIIRDAVTQRPVLTEEHLGELDVIKTSFADDTVLSANTITQLAAQGYEKENISGKDAVEIRHHGMGDMSRAASGLQLLFAMVDRKLVIAGRKPLGESEPKGLMR